MVFKLTSTCFLVQIAQNTLSRLSHTRTESVQDQYLCVFSGINLFITEQHAVIPEAGILREDI